MKLGKYHRAGNGGVPWEMAGVPQLGKARGFSGSVKVQNFGRKQWEPNILGVALIQQNLRLRATARILAEVPKTFIEKMVELGKASEVALSKRSIICVVGTIDPYAIYGKG